MDLLDTGTDLLDTGTGNAGDGRPARRRPTALAWAGPLLVALVVVPDVQQGGLDLLEPAGSTERPAAVSLLVDPQPTVVGRTDAAPWDGRLLLQLGADTVVLQASEAARSDAVGPGIAHAWGTLRAGFGDLRCTGTFGWRGTSRDPYGSGVVDLACDDGSEPAGVLRTTDRPPVEDAAASGILDLPGPPSREDPRREDLSR